jgi:hypothetical protein
MVAVRGSLLTQAKMLGVIEALLQNLTARLSIPAQSLDRQSPKDLRSHLTALYLQFLTGGGEM